MQPGPTPFYITGGTLGLDAQCYVERRADRELFEGLQRGEFCYVLTARQMGKSSLMARTAKRLRTAGWTVVTLDLTSLGLNLTSEQWYHGLLEQVSLQTGAEDELADFWARHAQSGPLQRWLGALQEVVRLVPARAAAGPTDGAPRVVIFVDEIDVVRSLPFPTDEFFAAIRECYNRRVTEPEFGRLTFCLLGVATPMELIRDAHITPFNVGRRIELADFAEADAMALGAGLGRDPKAAGAMMRRVFYWTGGHPYLTQVMCQAIATDPALSGPAGVDRLCDQRFLSDRARERDDNLMFVHQRLVRSQSNLELLLELYGRIWAGERVRDDPANPLLEALRLAGVVRGLDGWMQVRNRIYYRVFDGAWLRAAQPAAASRRGDELERHRRQVRRVVLALAAVVLVLLALGAKGLADWLAGQTASPSSSQASATAVRHPPTNAVWSWINLRVHVNGALTNAWFANTRAVPIGAVTNDVIVAGKTRFEVAGVVQLAGGRVEPRWPALVREIEVGRRVNRLHLLHAAHGSAPSGTEIATLVLHCAGGYRIELPVLFAKHVGPWERPPEPAPAGAATPGWQTPDGSLRLFESSWANPVPDVMIVSLDYVSRLAGPAPFLAGITLE
jgi:hypothetical protein